MFEQNKNVKRAKIMHFIGIFWSDTRKGSHYNRYQVSPKRVQALFSLIVSISSHSRCKRSARGSPVCLLNAILGCWRLLYSYLCGVNHSNSTKQKTIHVYAFGWESMIKINKIQEYLRCQSAKYCLYDLSWDIVRITSVEAYKAKWALVVYSPAIQDLLSLFRFFCVTWNKF